MFKLELQGCLPILLIFFLLTIVGFKLWYLFLAILFIFVVKNFASIIIFNYKNGQKQKDIHFEPQKGEIYKVCPNCGINVKRSAEKCPQCGKQFD